MKIKIIVLMLIGIVFISGCTQSVSYEQSAGVVSHNNSLEEAHQKCVDLCQGSSSIYPERSVRYIPTPKLNQCTDKECECLC